MKIALNVIGSLAVILAILGVFLPLLPTTPFLLLASACFARGSTRLHNWLLNNRVLGQYLRDYEAGRGIPFRAKVVAIVMLWSSLCYAALRTMSVPLALVLLMVGTGVTVYLVRFVPTLPGKPAGQS